MRNSWMLKRGRANTFMDAVAWEAVHRKGDTVVKNWINRELIGTGVTVILIGQYTAQRRFVRYEIEQSYKRGNGLLGIYIHGIKNVKGHTSLRGRNPMDDIVVVQDDPWLGLLGVKSEQRLSEIFQTYNWTQDDGRENMPQWIENAARIAGR